MNPTAGRSAPKAIAFSGQTELQSRNSKLRRDSAWSQCEHTNSACKGWPQLLWRKVKGARPDHNHRLPHCMRATVIG